MFLKAKTLLLIAVFIALQGCAAVSQMQVAGSYVTNGGAGQAFEAIPMTSIRLKDFVYAVTIFRWEPVTESARTRPVTVNWYTAEGKLVSTVKSYQNFKTTPYQFFDRIPATSLSLGKFRVDTHLEDTVASSNVFEIVP